MNGGEAVKRVLIADDEYLVRLGLRTTVDWAEHGFEIVGEAANGQEAVALFEQSDPDILLTDIKMPLMDGLELIEILKARKPSLYVVILSNYGDFAYAQRAIQLGASEYILKSDLTQQNILGTLQRVLASLQGQDGGPRHGRENQLRSYLRDFLLLPRCASAPPIPQGCLAPGSYAALVCRCDTSPLPMEGQAMFHRSSRAMLEKLWPGVTMASAAAGDILSVGLLARLDREEDFAALRQHALRTALNLRQYYDVEFQAGLSRPGQESRLGQLLERAAAAFEDCFFSGEPVCVYEDRGPAGREAARVNQAWMQDLVTAQDFGRLKTYIRQVFQALGQVRDYALVQAAFTDFLGFARHLLDRYPAIKGGFGDAAKLSYTSIESLRHIDTCESYVLDIFRTLGDLITGQGRRYSGVVSRAIEYIRGHYQENIALSDAADAVNLSKSHLSQLFKQETGINFSKYLMDFRVEQAKQLFSTSNLHIYEVAEKVGIPNPYYFSKVFKDATGFSCRDFRNKLHNPLA